jgi:hypothetical protein
MVLAEQSVAQNTGFLQWVVGEWVVLRGREQKRKN